MKVRKKVRKKERKKRGKTAGMKKRSETVHPSNQIQQKLCYSKT